MSKLTLRASAAGLALIALLALTGTDAAAQGRNQQQAPAPAAAPANDDPVVARVNNETITRTDVILALQSLGEQAQQLPLQQVYPQLLENLIAARLVSQEGYKQKLEATEEVKKRLEVAEDRFVQEAFLRKTIDAKITDAMVKARYDQWVKETPPEDEVRARHILVKDKAEAEAIIKQLRGGADFAKLAAEKGTDGSAQQGGDLGYFTASQMVEPFAQAAFAMKPGEVSKAPVETQFGFHVIKVEDKRKQTPPTFEQAAPQFRELVAQEIAAETVAALRKAAKVETFDLNGQPLPAPTPGAPAHGGGRN